MRRRQRRRRRQQLRPPPLAVTTLLRKRRDLERLGSQLKGEKGREEEGGDDEVSSERQNTLGKSVQCKVLVVFGTY